LFVGQNIILVNEMLIIGITCNENYKYFWFSTCYIYCNNHSLI